MELPWDGVADALESIDQIMENAVPPGGEEHEPHLAINIERSSPLTSPSPLMSSGHPIVPACACRANGPKEQVATDRDIHTILNNFTKTP